MHGFSWFFSIFTGGPGVVEEDAIDNIVAEFIGPVDLAQALAKVGE